MLLYHAALFHANRKPPTSATIDGSLRKDFRINFNFDSEKIRKQISQSLLLRNHHLFLIWSKSSKAACRLAPATMDWTCHSITRRCRRGYFEKIEYLYPNHYVNILPRRNNSRKQKAPCDKHDAFRNSFFTWKTSSRQNTARHCR